MKIIICVKNSDLILREMSKLGINVNNCRGKRYDGAGNMSGKNKGAAARILEMNPKAIYFHCQSHKLNLCIVGSYKLPMITNMMNQVRCIQEFFDYPKRYVLTEKINELSSRGTTRKKLINSCRTRWVQRVESFNVFFYLYPAIVAALTHICENEGRH